LRFFGEEDDDRLLLVNFGLDLNLIPAPEPLLAPPEGKEWRVLWSSEDPRYGGTGAPPLDPEEKWFLPGHAAMALCPATMPEEKILAAMRQREAEWRGEKKRR
jgi:maltooligosyltrehalose trehalohydrolase